MGGLLHLFDFHQGHTKRKHKKKGDVGLDAPRNSIDLPTENCRSRYPHEDCEQNFPKRSYYPTVASNHKLMHGEISKRSSNKQIAPSIVAKLMGVDMSPVDTPENLSLKDGTDVMEIADKKIQCVEKVSRARFPKRSKSYSKKEQRTYRDAHLGGSNLVRPLPRVHPQEEELQKFKKDFEAWQAARFLECVRVVELGNIPEQWLAQLDLTKEKMALYETSRQEAVDKSMGHKADRIKSRSFHGGDFHYLPCNKETVPAEHKETSSFSSRSSSRDFEQLSLKDSDQNSDKSSAPSRIVVLKPGPYSFGSNDETWVGSSSSIEDRDCIEDLLEEVKQRLKFEMDGGIFKKGSMIRGGGIETPFKEKPAQTNQTSQARVKQLKENISREFRRKLLRSESTRSYQSEFQADELVEPFPEHITRDERTSLGRKLFRSESARLYQAGFQVNEPSPSSPECMGNDKSRLLGRKLFRSESARLYQTKYQFHELAPSSPELMSSNTRKLLSGRNALNGESHQNLQNLSNDFSKAPWFDDARDRLEKARDILTAEAGRNCWHDMSYEADSSPARFFKHEVPDDGSLQEHPSPRNLVRSMSAPVSGTSFGKLLLEDRYVSSRARIKRKHEAPEKFVTYSKGQRKDRFNFREKVSNIKSSLSLRKKLLGRKLETMDLSQGNKFESVKDIMSGPTIITGLRYRNENSTEVPPSPASVCSTPREEFWKVMDNPSPLSNSDVTSVGDQSVANVFREISSNLTELRKQLNQLEYEASDITTLTEENSEAEVEDIEDEAETYIKHLLVTSGLYDGSWDKSHSRYDTYTKPLGDWIFEKSEESYRKPTNGNEEVADNDNERSLGRKLLFDLLNEALTIVLGPPRTLSKFRKKITDTTTLPLPVGRKLLDRVWQMICDYLNPPIDTDSYSLDDLVAHDLDTMPWGILGDEDILGLGKELECQLTGELVDELIMEMQV